MSSSCSVCHAATWWRGLRLTMARFGAGANGQPHPCGPQPGCISADGVPRQPHVQIRPLGRGNRSPARSPAMPRAREICRGTRTGRCADLVREYAAVRGPLRSTELIYCWDPGRAGRPPGLRACRPPRPHPLGDGRVRAWMARGRLRSVGEVVGVFSAGPFQWRFCARPDLRSWRSRHTQPISGGDGRCQRQPVRPSAASRGAVTLTVARRRS
jgi:hypothetical protein